MDVLLSIPIISFLISPGQTSWSTSFNVAFFFMTWATLIMSHSAIKVHLMGLLAIRAIFWLVPALISLLFDLGLPSVSENLKFGGRASLPKRNANRILRLLGLVLLNSFILIAVEGIASYTYLRIFQTTVFRTALTLPFPWQMFKHISALFVARELIQYYIHRHILHGSSSPIATLHQQYAHYTPGAPFALQLFADHPLPLILHRLVPIFVPSALIRPHLLTYFLFVGMVTLEETLAMSGYTIIPGIIMSGVTQRTAIHYTGSGGSNFAPLGVVDWAHSTSRGRGVIDDFKAEAEKHSLQERSEKKVDDGVGIMKKGMAALVGGGTEKSKEKKTKR